MTAARVFHTTRTHTVHEGEPDHTHGPDCGHPSVKHAGQHVDYLVNTRGLDSHRVVTIMGPAREDWLFELWVVPEGAPPPVPQR